MDGMTGASAFALVADRIRTVAFDLDGTIYFGEELAVGAEELLACLTARSLPHVFFTNNSGKTRTDIVSKLRRLGLRADESNTYTSGQATAEYVRRHGWREVVCIGTQGMREMLAQAGISTDGATSDAQALVIALVPDLARSALKESLAGLPANVPIIAANMDMDYPVEGGARKPGCGAIVLAAEEILGRRRDVVVGKPGTFMLDLLCDERGVDRSQVLVVGDSLESDIAMARAAGAPSVLIDAGIHAELADDHLTVAGLSELRTVLCGQTL